ncbi:MAG: RDD family protein [Candidatus Woesearchaeota archaeon]
MPKNMMIDASLAKRFLAFVVDLLVINTFFVYPFRNLINSAVPLTGFLETYNYISARPSVVLYSSLVIISILAFLYFFLLERMVGQTLGKLVFNLQIVAPNQSLWRYCLRSLFIIPLFPFVLLWLADPVFLLFAKKHQRLTEYLSQTKVMENVSW